MERGLAAGGQSSLAYPYDEGNSCDKSQNPGDIGFAIHGVAVARMIRVVGDGKGLAHLEAGVPVKGHPGLYLLAIDRVFHLQCASILRV